MIERGAEFDGYRVERLLGRGGMGVVYEATQVSLDRRVALKVLRPDLVGDPAFVDRFRREGRLQAAIEHPHVLDVYEVGGADPHGLFLAMRLIDGPTLAELLKRGELSAERALRLLEQVGDALDAAHAVGLVHRDVKPQNVLVGADDQAFLADFGLSRAGDDGITSSRPTMGTIAYVAPEVIAGDDPTPASDRYAFAASLFHCLTGDVVFPRGSDAAILFAHADEPPPRISARRPELPAKLDRIFAGALAKDPDARPSSARRLVTAVRNAIGEPILDGLGAPDRRRSDDVDSETAAAPVVSRAVAGGSRLRSAATVALVAVVAAALGVGAVALVGGDDDRDQGTTEVRVPPLPDGAIALGSALGAPDRVLGCGDSDPTRIGPACVIAQTDLPGAQLVVPADGTIVGWAVRGASGDVALDVLRPGGDETTRVARSQWERVGNEAPFHFPTELPVERGDLIGVELGAGSAIGAAAVADAATQRWLAPKGGFYGSPDRGPGTGYDYELLLRADFVAGAEPEQPEKLTGAAADGAPNGHLRERATVDISDPPAAVEVALVEVGNRVALDLLRGERRIERMFVPDLVRGGRPIDLKTYTYEGEPFSEVDVWWVNPASGRVIFHFFTVSARQISFTG